MKIYGLQKMTMLDYPGRVAATVFTGGCNMRCPFCHNAGLVEQLDPADEISADEVLGYLKKRKGILDGVCITGGEPLLHKDIDAFISEIKALGLPVKLDTNGSFPERLKDLVSCGLVDYVAMDIKNSKEKYPLTTGVENFPLDGVEESVKYLLGSPCEYEFRTTLVKEYHNIEDMKAIGMWICGAKNYFLQGFKDSGNLIGEGKMSPPDKIFVHEVQEMLTEFVQNVEIRGIE